MVGFLPTTTRTNHGDDSFSMSYNGGAGSYPSPIASSPSSQSLSNSYHGSVGNYNFAGPSTTGKLYHPSNISSTAYRTESTILHHHHHSPLHHHQGKEWSSSPPRGPPPTYNPPPPVVIHTYQQQARGSPPPPPPVLMGHHHHLNQHHSNENEMLGICLCPSCNDGYELISLFIVVEIRLFSLFEMQRNRFLIRGSEFQLELVCFSWFLYKLYFPEKKECSTSNLYNLKNNSFERTQIRTLRTLKHFRKFICY